MSATYLSDTTLGGLGITPGEMADAVETIKMTQDIKQEGDEGSDDLEEFSI